MKFTVVTTEMMSIIILALLLYGSVFEINRKVKKNGAYISTVGICIAALIVDMVAWIVDGTSVPEPLIFLSDYLSFILGYLLIVSYTVYILTTLSEKRPVPKYITQIVLVMLIIAIAYVTYGSLIGKVFTIQDHCYITGPWYKRTQIFTDIMMVLNAWLILSNAKHYGLHDTVALMAYIVYPIGATLLHYVVPQISLTFIGSMYSQVTIYLMLQAEQESEFRMKERILLEVANTDALTGLQNRHAYEEAIEKLQSEPKIDVLFLDINGLKYTNDNFGHKAGDDLIGGFAQLLRKHFDHEEIFRISGDEFVILVSGIHKVDFNRRVEKFKKAQVKDGKPLSAIGASRSTGTEIVHSIKEAESKMYEDKEVFHQQYPEMKGR